MKVNLHHEPMQIKVQSLTQVVGYGLLFMVLLVEKNWQLKMRRQNLQYHHLQKGFYSRKNSRIQCFKCGGHGHVIRECPNNHTSLLITWEDTNLLMMRSMKLLMKDNSKRLLKMKITNLEKLREVLLTFLLKFEVYK